MRHDDAYKEWEDLGIQGLNPSAISYKKTINIRTVQWGRPRDVVVRAVITESDATTGSGSSKGGGSDVRGNKGGA